MQTTRISKLRIPAAVPTLRLPGLRETATALLRVLSAGVPASKDAARIIMLDPVLVFELLQTRPLQKSESASLLEALTQRVENTDAGLLQAWALRHIVQQPQRRTNIGSHRHHSLHSQFVAELAAHIARETGYAAPEEAYAVGLLHDIGLLWLSEYADDYLTLLAEAPDERTLTASEWERYGQDHAEISSSLAARCGLPAGVADAIALHQADANSLVSAHPLVRVAAAAEELAAYRGNQAPLSLDNACSLTQLDGAILVSLLADTTRTVQDRASALGIPVETTMLSRPWSTTGTERNGPEMIDAGIARAALGAFTRSSFSKGGSAWTDFSLAARLLLGFDAPVLFVKPVDSDELTGAANPAHPGLSQIHIAANDQNSVIAEAYRDNVETRFQAAPRPPGRCAADWQLARWLESDGLLCVPWSNSFESGVAVFPCPSAEDAGEEIEHTLRQLLTEAATVRISERNAEERMRHEIEENIGRRYVDHARRIAHEASNPLTVIKTYLGIIDEKVEDATLKEQLNLLSDELDRVGALIRKTSDFTGILPTGPAHSGVAEILHDLRALYGEALFARRGIHFELRTSPNLPAAAIPPDALKQVLLNLFKNAAEAIPEGGKLTVSAVAGINANGSPCLEVRVVDNGPGMSPERVQNLFAGGARNSTKPGGGVGLPVVRELVTSNGGTILCRSQLGSGTVFQIFMPLAA
ncbi:MAG: HDOD domain-containing protein [Zoogloea sp.]|uniref:ATP-binding protein n=1 Tax=Zoogloea sp. TaxID=49181 RepID=UPI0026169B44|nr:ATP-binding protein [Zoogloea sp.]MDD2987413.1 HDOD domain-containing protein [Zoogloea sp.]